MNDYQHMDDHTLLVLATQKLDKLNGTVAQNVVDIQKITTLQEQHHNDIQSIWDKFDQCIHLTFRQFLIVLVVIATISVGGTISAVEYI